MYPEKKHTPNLPKSYENARYQLTNTQHFYQRRGNKFGFIIDDESILIHIYMFTCTNNFEITRI